MRRPSPPPSPATGGRAPGTGVRAALRFSWVAAALFSAVAAWAVGPYVKGLTWRFHESNVVASFGVGEALERPDVKETIQSTRAVSFTFTVEVLKHRTIWKSKVLGRRVVVHTVKFDTLTRQYTLETTVDGERTDQRVVDSWDEMARYMENVNDLTVCSVADIEPSGATYTVRARVHVQSEFVLWIIPWDVETPWVSQPLATP